MTRFGYFLYGIRIGTCIAFTMIAACKWGQGFGAHGFERSLDFLIGSCILGIGLLVYPSKSNDT